MPFLKGGKMPPLKKNKQKKTANEKFNALRLRTYIMCVT